MAVLIDLAEAGLLPDTIIRLGIRRRLAQRLAALPRSGSTAHQQQLVALLAQLNGSPLAIATAEANTQHYEVPAAFYQQVLGPRLKYSACLFAHADSTLAEAECDMLQLSCQRAELADGMQILELGCGWGALTLWMAEHYPKSTITAVSNSASQREFIQRRAEQSGFTNVRVVTADMRSFQTPDTFDRVVSVEMFEHMRNYQQLFQRVAGWLREDGKAWVHVFCHRDTPYLFETEGDENWMGRHFFSGGTMPSESLFGHFSQHLSLAQQWRVSGLHYGRTCEAWLTNLDQHRAALLPLFQQDGTLRAARRRLQRWRMFFLACAELFRYRQGEEWFVAHYLLEHAAANRPRSVAKRPPQAALPTD